MALKGEVGVIPRISYLWYLTLKTYIWNRTCKIILIRLRAEWECMQMESMISSIRWPFYVKFVSPSVTTKSMTPLFTGPRQTAIASKECVPQEWGSFENCVVFPSSLMQVYLLVGCCNDELTHSKKVIEVCNSFDIQVCAYISTFLNRVKLWWMTRRGMRLFVTVVMWMRWLSYPDLMQNI